MTTFRVGSASDVGQVRQNNQDSKYVGQQVEVYAVADGMGGHQGGEVASAIAVETLEAVITEPTTASVVEAVKEANRRIFSRAADVAELRGMGTTLVAIALVNKDAADEEVAWVNVGDSRAYLLRDGELHQLSRDHSLVEDLKRGGQLSEEEAAVHPQRNILTRALGIDNEVEVDSGAVEPWQGDRFLLCSDGLFNEVDRATLIATLSEIDDPDAAAARLVELANAGGGRDNITCVVADVIDDGGRADRAAAAAAAASTAAVAAGDGQGADPTVVGATLDAPTAEMPAVAADATVVDDVPTAQTPGPPPAPTGPGLPTPTIPGPPPPPADGPDGADGGQEPAVPVAEAAAAPGAVPADGPFPTPSDPGFPTDTDAADADERPMDDLPFGRDSEDPFADIDKAKRGHWVFVVLGTVLVLAVLGGGLYLAGQWYANRTYFLDEQGGEVVVMQGQPGGFVIFDPTVADDDLDVTVKELEDEAANAVANNREFDSLADAQSFVRLNTLEEEPPEPTTTTTTEPESTTTTTEATTTTRPGSTTTTAPTTTTTG